MHSLDSLINRITKTNKARRKWAKREGIEAYRVYEMDIPELRYIVDVYRDQAVIYDKRGENADAKEDPAEDWAITNAVAEALDLKAPHIHLKKRRRMPGTNQYTKLGETGNRLVVQEGALKFGVNLVDYLDTGLFLDHRPLRKEFTRLASGTRFLNLFCYTGAVSVAAAFSGARTTSVDLSHTYLEWAGDNFILNAIATEKHRFVQADAREYLAGGPAKGEAYDVVFLDPPTFSNSKRMAGTFDVARDHGDLIRNACRFLTPKGVLYFSTNKHKFRIDQDLTEVYKVEDISEATIPPDFRNRKIHRCFRIRGE